MAAPASKTSPVAIELPSKNLSVEMTEQNPKTEADPLHIDLSSVLSLEAKHTIIATLWDSSLALVDYSDNEHRFSAYLTYYEHECQQMSVGGRGLLLPFFTHRQVLDTIVTISTARSQPYNELQELLREKYPVFQKASQDNQNLGITLCLRLWLMINIRDPTDGNSVAGVRKVVWNKPVSVMSFIQETLSKNAVSSRENPASCSSHEFNAYNLDRMANIRIQFTANLVDHLIYDDDTHRLLVFHFNSFLTAHLMPLKQNSVCLGVLDESFLRETQQTLNLIFPAWDADSTAYLRRLKKESGVDLDPSFGNVAHMPYTFSPSSFQFYGTRLEALKEALSSTKKVSTKQLWFDRRNRQAWCTLWVAVVVFVLTVIFGIISSVTSIMQVDIALKTARAAGVQGL
ncbi:hypothetical protein K440DRAFT_637770 [Wilcoxina mikolae CBS 423.85]|nr:hypothetical protein K440DRAFT_637770 [Wilcoxina mikolae CBS 423.85]